ncbi:MAG: phosphate acyltransferase PlsX [Pseudomonadota bacterium]
MHKDVTTIAIDAMSGDFGLAVTVPATCQFLQAQENASYAAILVGDEEQLEAALNKEDAAGLVQSGRMTIKHASQVVEMHEEPALALKRKKDSSMRVAINLVKEGEAAAAVSAGNTGALMATARFVLRMIGGVNRPAICTSMPCIQPDRTVLMLDMGANVDSAPEVLRQFAVMGSVLSEASKKISNPSVALLNVGAEDIKGSEKVKQAAALLADTDINYVGFVEGDEILAGEVDVVVADGFEGNIALKTSEGTAKVIMTVLREEFRKNWMTKLVGLLATPIFRAVQSRMDPRLHNGATMLGLNGIVIKSHGGTDALGFRYAIAEAAQQASFDLVGGLSKGVGEKISES